VWLGRRRLVRRNAAPVLASIDELGKRQLQLNAFGRKHEDGRTHPYPVVRAPAPSADKLGISWQLADKHDNSHAVMVGLGTDIAADKDPDIFIRLPLNGHPGGFVRVRAEVDGHRATWEPLAARLAPLLAPFAPAIIELQQLSAPHEREQQVLQSLGIRSFTPQVTSCPGCGRTTSTFFQSMAEEIQGYLRTRMTEWRDVYPGVEELKVAVMGCVVNGPGESKHADIGISLPGTFEEPKAPVFMDGELLTTLKGDAIVAEFLAILDEYVARRWGAPVG